MNRQNTKRMNVAAEDVSLRSAASRFYAPNDERVQKLCRPGAGRAGIAGRVVPETCGQDAATGEFRPTAVPIAGPPREADS